MKELRLNIYDLPLAKNMKEYNFDNKKLRTGKLFLSKEVVELASKVIVNELIDKHKK